MPDDLTTKPENRNDHSKALGPDMRISAATQTDVLTATEYREVFGKRALSPEEGSISAVLTDAIDTFNVLSLPRTRKARGVSPKPKLGS